MQIHASNPQEKIEAFQGYLDTFNAALAAHAEEFPYKQLVRGGEAYYGGDNIGVAVYKHDPAKPHDFHTIKIEDGAFRYVGHGKVDARVDFRTSEKRLVEVAENPEPFIEDPSRLELGWLERKLGIRR